MPPLDVPEVDPARCWAKPRATDLGLMPELSEIEIIRHFTRLSTWNYAIDLGMYPLGSCTMKYNPRVNEFVSRLEGIAEAHPYQPEVALPGCARDHRACCNAACSTSPAWTPSRCSRRRARMGSSPASCWCARTTSRRAIRGSKIIIPDSAHGTNPATAASAATRWRISVPMRGAWWMWPQLEQIVTEDTAALMLTNPSTIGVFESEIHKIADILHAKGALLYMDGANMNALVGKTRPGDFGVDVMHLNLHKTFSTPHGGGGPGSGPVAAKKILEPFLPTPVVVQAEPDQHGRRTLRLDYDRPQSIGRVRMFLRQLRHVRPRPGLHHGQRPGRPAADH